jgi:hypothetical protein
MLASGLVTEGNVLIGSELPPTPRIACLSVGGSLYSLSLSKWLPIRTERSDINHIDDVRPVFARTLLQKLRRGIRSRRFNDGSLGDRALPLVSAGQELPVAPCRSLVRRQALPPYSSKYIIRTQPAINPDPPCWNLPLDQLL